MLQFISFIVLTIDFGPKLSDINFSTPPEKQPRQPQRLHSSSKDEENGKVKLKESRFQFSQLDHSLDIGTWPLSGDTRKS